MSHARTVRGFALVAVLGLAAAPAAIAGPGGSHPYFNDRGTLTWHKDLASAQRDATACSKLVFIEYGRRACGNCRVLVSCVMPNPAVASRLSATCVGLAADCDEPDPRVEALFSRNLPDANMLPFVAIVTPDLRWITGWAGSIDVNGVCSAVSQAECWLRRCAQAAKPTPPPVPVAPQRAPAPPPAPAPVPAPPPIARAPDAPRPAPVSLPPAIAHVAPAAEPVTPAPTPPAPPVATPVPAKPAVRAPAPAAVPASKASTPVRTGQFPTAADGEPALLAAAQSAAAAEQWGDVIRLGNEAARLPKGTDTWELDLLVHRARVWTLESMDAAVKAATTRHLEEARAVLDRVERVMDRLPAREDARRGREALKRIEDIDRGSPDAPEATDAARKDAYAEFRGSRWAVLFQAR